MVPVRYRSRACSDAWNAASRPARAERLRAMPATTVFHSRWIASPAASVARSWRADVTPQKNGWLVLTSGAMAEDASVTRQEEPGCARDTDTLILLVLSSWMNVTSGVKATRLRIGTVMRLAE